MPELFKNGVINGFDFKNYHELIKYLKNMSEKEYISRINTIKKYRDQYFTHFGYNEVSDFIMENIFNQYINVKSNPLLEKINNEYIK